MRGVVAATEAIREEAISLILNPPKTGRIYRRRGVEHQASAPGEAPASDTGFLASSITTKYDASKLSGQVVVGAAYGPHLEYGTQTMEPRPFLRPAIANRRKETLRIIRDEVARELK
jgi:HK97 gp10 family phage protein